MPRVAIKTGFLAPDGSPDDLTEFICDSPGCPNIATQVLGYSMDLGIALAVCDEHAAPSGTAEPIEARRGGAG